MRGNFASEVCRPSGGGGVRCATPGRGAAIGSPRDNSPTSAPVRMPSVRFGIHAGRVEDAPAKPAGSVVHEGRDASAAGAGQAGSSCSSWLSSGGDDERRGGSLWDSS